MTYISKHFSYREMTRSETARRHGIDNTPSPAELDNIRYTAKQMEKVNRLVGGSRTSAHRYGLAVDCDATGLTSAQFATEIIEMKNKGVIDYDQLILEFPERGDGAWVHIGFKKNGVGNRRQVLTAVKRNGKTVYLQGLVL